jgi:hypothetical protein
MSKKTKVTDLTQGVKKRKPIEFVKVLERTGVLTDNPRTPSTFNNVQRVLSADTSKYDIIIAWDDDTPACKYTYLGHWNDGYLARCTKVTDLTQGVNVKGKPIEFVMFLNPDGILTELCCRPNQWDNLQRIARGKYDAIIAWNDNTNNRAIYLGHWNDGYVDND